MHGRRRAEHGDEVHFGVHSELLFAKANMAGAQWTGIVTSIACEMLRSGAVQGVVCVASSVDNPLRPRPILALTEEDVLSSRGVKPMLSANLSVLAEVEARGLKRLLFIGVGCAVQALRSVERHLGLDELYVLGTNCTDNGREAGLNKFLAATGRLTGRAPEAVIGYEFCADYRVHLKYADGTYAKLPYFSLPAEELSEGVIAPSCLACFDYTNGLADLVVGYMGVPPEDMDMTQHTQYVTVRNARGRLLLDAARAAGRLTTSPPVSAGDRRLVVMETVLTDDAAALGRAKQPAPLWVGEMLASALTQLGPRGLEFARFSIDYHTLRNVIFTRRTMPHAQAEAHIPPHARAMLAAYDGEGAVSRRFALGPGDPEPAAQPQPAVAAAAAAAAAAALLLALLWTRAPMP